MRVLASTQISSHPPSGTATPQTALKARQLRRQDCIFQLTANTNQCENDRQSDGNNLKTIRGKQQGQVKKLQLSSLKRQRTKQFKWISIFSAKHSFASQP